MLRTRPSLFALSALLFVSIGTAQACQICVPIPTESAADHILAARTVILAREAAFAYQPVEVLKGKAPEAKIDLLVDSATRRLLAANPERSVLLVESPNGEWRRIGLADAEVKSITRKVLVSGVKWEAEPRSRVAYFSNLLNHANPQLRKLAHLEVGRAPYDEIRRLGEALTREEIRTFLADLRYMEWHPLYILLLAQNPDAEDRATIVKSFRSAARFRTTTRLAAWATAYVEIEGEKAIAEIEQTFFKTGERSVEELREVAKALSVHGSNGDKNMRDRIVKAYEVLVANYPSLTPQVATDLIAWKRTELAEAVGKYVASKPAGIDFGTTLRLRAYARQTQSKP
jgi:hypothetical protein